MILGKEITGTGVKYEVKFEQGEISFSPQYGKGVIAIRFDQKIGDFFRNIENPEERENIAQALGNALVGAVENATSRIMRAQEGLHADITRKEN